jgi:CheY-like chemotaxis protein
VRILAVDDSKIALRQISRVLRAEGLTVVEAVSGEEALIVLEFGSVDVIMIDYYLGDMKAPEFVRRARVPKGLSRPLSNAPIILVSGAPEHEDLFDGVLEKPYTDSELLTALRKVLNDGQP